MDKSWNYFSFIKYFSLQCLFWNKKRGVEGIILIENSQDTQAYFSHIFETLPTLFA